MMAAMTDFSQQSQTVRNFQNYYNLASAVTIQEFGQQVGQVVSGWWTTEGASIYARARDDLQSWAET